MADTSEGAVVKSMCDPLACRCMKVSRATVQAAIVNQKLRTIDDITTATEAGGACTCCHRVLQKMLNAEWGEGDVRVPLQLCAAPIK